MHSVSIYTLGCKLNQLESEALADSFIHCGFTLLPFTADSAQADLIIINTCTVTSRADQKARRVIRKSLLDSLNSVVIVTGCYAKLDREKIAVLDDGTPADTCGGRRLFVCGDKSRLLDLPVYLRETLERENARAENLGPLIAAWLETEAAGCESAGCENAGGESAGCENAGGESAGSAFRFIPRRFSFHTRGFLKIHDGCNNHCTYCRIRLARGPGLSMPAAGVLAELQSLEERGFWEAVLTGVNISQYHDDALPGNKGLSGLLNYLLGNTSTIGLRLSSLEPESIDAELCAILAHERIRPHFHLSVQSGSDSVLRRMGRSYTRAAVEQAVYELRAVKRNPFLACDIITGFPGETAADFNETRELCRSAEFAWIHAFPYSKRPGTAAFSFAQTVPEREAVRRVEELTDIARQGRRAYVNSWLGSELEALIEKGRGGQSGSCRALSANYLKLLLRCPQSDTLTPGTVVRCTITEAPAPDQQESGIDAIAVALLTH